MVFVKKGDTSFIIHFCVDNEWMCSGAYIDKHWILTTVACSMLLQMDTRIEAVASNATFSCIHRERRPVKSSFVYTLEYFSLDTDIAMVKIEEPFRRKLGVTQIEMSIYEVNSKTCSLFGLRKISSKVNYDKEPLKGFQSQVLRSEECLKYYNIEPRFFICLSKIPGAQVWNFPVVCEGALEGFVVADDEELLIALRLVVFYEWIRNQTNPKSLRSSSSSESIFYARQYSVTVLPLAALFYKFENFR
ncbi:hypothetical protein Trydic_g5287 [Trypoxylus dichotomus]